MWWRGVLIYLIWYVSVCTSSTCFIMELKTSIYIYNMDMDIHILFVVIHNNVTWISINGCQWMDGHIGIMDIYICFMDFDKYFYISINPLDISIAEWCISIFEWRISIIQIWISKITHIWNLWWQNSMYIITSWVFTTAYQYYCIFEHIQPK